MSPQAAHVPQLSASFALEGREDDPAQDRILRSTPLSAEAAPLVEGLAADYSRRYGEFHAGGASGELERYPPAAFAPPFGGFLLVRRGAETIAGGAFMSHDDETVELKRIWTHPRLRRQGIARRIVVALEDEAAALGYVRAYLTTGFRQPEAVGLYLSLGYRPLFDVGIDPMLFRSLPFEKHIGVRAGEPGTAPLRRAAASFEDASAEVAAIKAEQEKKVLARLRPTRAAE